MTGIPSFSGLQTSLRALLAQQAAIDTTGHNIANANTVGYTRQEAVMSAARPLSLSAGAVQSGAGAQLGQGVDVLTYRRMRDQFGDLQYRAQNMTYGGQSTMAGALGAAEDATGEPSDTAVNALFSTFWSAWQSVATHPADSTTKTALAGAARNLSGAIGTLATNLAAVQTSAGQQLTDLTAAGGPVQSALQEIARLNQGIKDATGAGVQPNDLLDRRDQLLDELSAYGQVSTTSLPDNSIQVSLDGQQIVNDTTFTWPGTYTATNGSLGALATAASASGPIAGYLTDLDAIANQLTTSVNAISPGFFTGTTASTIAVSVGVLANPATIVTGAGAPGDGSAAQAVANLRGGASDAGRAYASLIVKIGTDSADASRSATTADTLRGAAQERRQSINGVSLDEEMTNLVRFQRAYQAASRAFSTMDEALDTLINRTGRVGL